MAIESMLEEAMAMLVLVNKTNIMKNNEAF